MNIARMFSKIILCYFLYFDDVSSLLTLIQQTCSKISWSMYRLRIVSGTQQAVNKLGNTQWVRSHLALPVGKIQ